MKRDDLSLSSFKGGWLVGDFDPAIFKRKDVEVGLKHLRKGFLDTAHYHQHAVEFNFVVSGSLLLETGDVVTAGECFVYEKYEVSRCTVLEDSIVLIVRDSSDPLDKIECE